MRLGTAGTAGLGVAEAELVELVDVEVIRSALVVVATTLVVVVAFEVLCQQDQVSPDEARCGARREGGDDAHVLEVVEVALVVATDFFVVVVVLKELVVVKLQRRRLQHLRRGRGQERVASLRLRGRLGRGRSLLARCRRGLGGATTQQNVSCRSVRPSRVD